MSLTNVFWAHDSGANWRSYPQRVRNERWCFPARCFLIRSGLANKTACRCKRFSSSRHARSFKAKGNAFTLLSGFFLLSHLLYLFSLVESIPVHYSICTREKNENIWPKCPSVAKHSLLKTAFPLTVFPQSTVFILVFIFLE